MPLTKQLSSSGSMSEDPSQEDEEVFEITDFTNASDWEKFIAQLEECITEWQLNHYIKFLPLTLNELANGEWEVLKATINYSSVSFNLSLHRLKQKENTEQYLEEKEDEDDFHLPQYADDIMNIENDFPPRAHCLARWYGLRCFLVLMPADQVQTINHSKSNLLRSSANIALHNTSCDVPLFMQIKDSWQRLYVGAAVSQGVSTNFEIACLKRVPTQYSHVSGLSYIFKTKLGVPGLSSDKLHVSARFTYVLDDWGSERRWPDKAISQEEIAKNFKSLPHGCIEDPVNGLTLAAVWPSTTGDGVSDNDVQQGFDALSAPEWTLRLQYADNVPFMLSYSLTELIKVLASLDTMADLMNFHSPQPPSQDRDIGHALDRITDPMTKSVLSPIVSPKLAEGISKVVSNSQNFIKRGAVSIGRMTVAGERIPRELMEEIKTFLFSEDGDDSAEANNAKQLTYMQVKAAPRNSFSYRLAVCSTVLNLCYGGIWALAQLWHMVMTELRTYLDSGKCIPGLDSVGPDHRSCLIHQKLQMLNCCISRKKAREAYTNMQKKGEEGECKVEEQIEEESTGEISVEVVEVSVENVQLEESESAENVESTADDESMSTSVKQTSTSEDSDDEFFECDDGEEDEPTPEDPVEETTEENQPRANEKDEMPSDQASSDEKNDEVTEESEQNECEGDHLQAEGRLKQLDNLKLLHKNTPLYIPVTQDHALLTEDQLEEQAEIFSNLGDTKEGSKVRAKMQSVSLEADMSAFKAANPGCLLEDFVRWYSPRDFENGALSTRMLIPDNLWVTTWNAAQAIPAHRQKRLFDDTKEAEKVLHFLANLKPSQVAQLILPICIYDSLLRLRSYRDTLSEVLPSLPLLCNQVEQKAARLFRNWTTTNPPLASSVDLASPVNELIRQIGFAEKIIERARSLLHKFSGLDNQADMNKFVRELLEHPEIRVQGAANGRVGKIVRRFFFMQQEKAQKSAEHDNPNATPAPIQPLPDPFGREFILRCVIRHPTDFSQKLPQRLYAVLMRNEFRLASAISTDSTFF